MSKRYEMLPDETAQAWNGKTLFRIRALIDFGDVKAGDKGGFIENERNLSQDGNSWVSGSAHVYGSARVSGSAHVYGSACVYGSARVSGSACAYGSARVSGSAYVSGVLLTCSRSDGYTFAVAATPAGPRVMAGCRYFGFDEAVAHWTATRGGTKLGEESLAIVAHLRVMATLNGFDAPVVDPVTA